MKVVYASRMGKVEDFVTRLKVDNVLKIKDGTEMTDEDYVLITYTDGKGIIPPAVEKFLENNAGHMKKAAVSGNSQRHADTFCGAADKLIEKYGVEIIARFENNGDDEALEKVRAAL